MREILFRGKTEEGKWFEGDLFRNIRRDYIRDYIRFKSPDDPFEMNYECKQVIHETVGQYTGLTDKNGKKIFEGDVVRDLRSYFCHKLYFERGLKGEEDYERYREEGETAVVVFSTEDFGSCGCCYEEFVGSGFAAFGVDLSCCEVIGNIYDTPDLMKGGE